jgi:hypothetical protein
MDERGTIVYIAAKLLRRHQRCARALELIER